MNSNFEQQIVLNWVLFIIYLANEIFSSLKRRGNKKSDIRSPVWWNWISYNASNYYAEVMTSLKQFILRFCRPSVRRRRNRQRWSLLRNYIQAQSKSLDVLVEQINRMKFKWRDANMPRPTRKHRKTWEATKSIRFTMGLWKVCRTVVSMSSSKHLFFCTNSDQPTTASTRMLCESKICTKLDTENKFQELCCPLPFRWVHADFLQLFKGTAQLDENPQFN